MGACGSSTKAAPEPPHPAVSEPWPLKEEATRIFKLVTPPRPFRSAAPHLARKQSKGHPPDPALRSRLCAVR